MAKSKSEKQKQPGDQEGCRQTKWPKSKGRKSKTELNTLQAKEMYTAQDRHYFVFFFQTFFLFFLYGRVLIYVVHLM